MDYTKTSNLLKTKTLQEAKVNQLLFQDIIVHPKIVTNNPKKVQINITNIKTFENTERYRWYVSDDE